MTIKEMKCPLRQGRSCSDLCAWFDHEENCCCIRVLTRALENIAEYIVGAEDRKDIEARGRLVPYHRGIVI